MDTPLFAVYASCGSACPCRMESRRLQDPLECPRCRSPMKVIAVITEPEEVKKILRHLVKVGPGRAADHHPGWNRASCNLLSVSFVSVPRGTLSLQSLRCSF